MFQSLIWYFSEKVGTYLKHFSDFRRTAGNKTERKVFVFVGKTSIRTCQMSGKQKFSTSLTLCEESGKYKWNEIHSFKLNGKMFSSICKLLCSLLKK